MTENANRIRSALGSDSRWAVFCALIELSSRTSVSNSELERLTGRSARTVKRARKSLKALGLITFHPHAGGRDITKYAIADIERPDVVERVLARLNAAKVLHPCTVLPVGNAFKLLPTGNKGGPL